MLVPCFGWPPSVHCQTKLFRVDGGVGGRSKSGPSSPVVVPSFPPNVPKRSDGFRSLHVILPSVSRSRIFCTEFEAPSRRVFRSLFGVSAQLCHDYSRNFRAHVVYSTEFKESQVDIWKNATRVLEDFGSRHVLFGLGVVGRFARYLGVASGLTIVLLPAVQCA